MKVGEAPPYKVIKTSSPGSASGNPQREGEGYDPHNQSDEQNNTDERRSKSELSRHIDYLA